MNRSTKVRPAAVHPIHPTTSADYALRLTREAQLWQQHAAEQSRMREATLASKALDAVAFSLEVKAHTLAIPTKLSGTSQHQDALRQLDELSPLRGHRLALRSTEGDLQVYFQDLMLGCVQGKHVPWLRPLIPFGATLHLLQVTGRDRDDGFLGVNVAIASVAPAIDRYRRAGADDHAGGDGVAEAPAMLALEDVYLWRDRMGKAHSSVTAESHWSESGINWGYSGHGPTDLSLAILKRFADVATAERLCAAFRDDVIAAVPFEGAVLRGAAIVAWLHRYGA